MKRRRGFVPQPECGNWPLKRKLELNWIIGELNWFRADRHPSACEAAIKRFPGIRNDIPALEARAHEWLCIRMLSRSPGYNLEAQAALYQLLADTAADFNRTVFDSNAPYSLEPDGPWPFKYWSYLRWSTLKLEDVSAKASDPYRYRAAYLTIGGGDCIYFDRIRRAQMKPITVREVPAEERTPPTLS